MAVQNGIDSKQALSTTSNVTFNSATLTSPLTGANGGTGVANTGSTITIGGNLVTTPANSLTLTTTGITNVTLPTSGTLATTSQIPSTPISLANGGTNASLTADNGGIVYSTATAMSILPHTATANQPLLSGASGAPGWSTATYPGSTNINRILYSSANNVVGQITSANSGVLITDTSGIPSISNTLTLVNSSTTMETLQCTDAGATAGPIVDLYRNSASPAASDVLGQIQFNGQDGGNSKQLYAQITAQADTVTAGAGSARLTFSTDSGGALTTQLAMLNTGCQIRGNNANAAPTSGYIGELISNTVTSGTPTSLSTGTPKTIQTITFTTAGTYSISLVMGLFGATAKTSFVVGISSNTNSFTGTVQGDTQIDSNYPLGTLTNNFYVTIPSVVVTVAASTSYYGVAQSAFTVGTETAWGRLSAVRIG